MAAQAVVEVLDRGFNSGFRCPPTWSRPSCPRKLEGARSAVLGPAPSRWSMAASEDPSVTRAFPMLFCCERRPAAPPPPSVAEWQHGQMPQGRGRLERRLLLDCFMGCSCLTGLIETGRRPDATIRCRNCCVRCACAAASKICSGGPRLEGSRPNRGSTWSAAISAGERYLVRVGSTIVIPPAASSGITFEHLADELWIGARSSPRRGEPGAGPSQAP